MNTSSSNTQRCTALVISAMVAFGAFSAHAQDINYNDPGSSNYIGTAVGGTRLIVGDDEADISLFVTNGGLVEISLQAVVGNDSNATNNLLQVEDGSFVLIGNTTTNGLSSNAAIVVGDTDGEGEFRVDYDSEAKTEDMYVGRLADESGSVTLKNGGQLSVSGTLTVGAADNSENLITIADGGRLAIGHETNIVINTGTNDSNKININSGGAVLIRGDVDATSITERTNLNFKAGAILGSGGEFTIENNAIKDSLNILLDNALSTNHTAQWHTDAIYVGEKTSDNSLTLTNGAQVSATGSVYIGDEASARGNSLQVSGTNSMFTVGANLFVGKKGDSNSLLIENGGQVGVGMDLIIGSSAEASQNTATITGTNCQLAVANNFILGSASANNRYFQTGGTNTVAGEFIIGRTEDATGKTDSPDPEVEETTGNLALVGTNATLNIQQNLTVGKEGGGSILSIRDGGEVNVAGDAVIGEGAGDNYIYLRRDADTRFNVAGDLVVGKEGGVNRFAAYGGTATIDGDMYLGASTNQHENKNFIHLETTNAVLNVANAIHIGASNSINTLDLAKGAKAYAQDLLVGAYEGTSNNVVTVDGEDSLLSISNQLVIGSNTGSNNNVTVRNGGILYAQQNNIEIAGTNNTLDIKDGGTLQTEDWNFVDMTGTATNIVFHSGSALELAGVLSGTNQVEGGIGFTLNETNALWDTGTNVLHVGHETGNNSLTITNGALATTATNLYIGFASFDNTATVGGTGSVLNIGTDLFIGNAETNDSGNNILFVTDSGEVTVGNDLINAQGGTLKIGAGSQVRVAGNYEQKYLEEFNVPSLLEVGVSSNATPPNLEVEGTANFEEKTTIAVYDDGVHGNTNVVQTIVLADELTIGNQAATTSLLDDMLNIETNLLLGFDVTVSNNMIIVDNFIVRDMGEELGLEGQLLNVANEITEMKEAGDEKATEMMKIISDLTTEEGNKTFHDYYGEKASSAPMHNVINQGIGSIASELTVRSDTTRKRATAPVPFGATGPHTWSQGLQGWIAGYGTWGNKSDADGFHGYDANLAGFIIGADIAVSKNILVGLAGGSNSGSVDKDNGASGDTKSAYGAAYASVGTQDWFLDGSVILGTSSIATTLGTTSDTTASYDAQNIAFYLGGGKEIIGKYLVITPQASLLVNQYEQDAYEEEATTGVPRTMDAFDALYVQSSLGCNLALYTMVGEFTLKPELRAHWLHEFNGDEESLSYHLINGDGTTHNMLLQAPEEDILKLGAGVATKMSEYLELRFDLDTRMGSNYSDYTATGSLRYQF